MVPLDQIRESPENPRKTFDPGKMAELVASVTTKGVLQPILVRDVATGAKGRPPKVRYEIVCGSRRFRASVQAGRPDVPAIVVEMTDAEAMEAMVVENDQREDVHPLEERDGFAALVTKYGYTYDQIAERVGRPVAYVARRIRLGNLSKLAEGMFLSGQLTVGAAEELGQVPAPLQDEVCRSRHYMARISAADARGDIRRFALTPLKLAIFDTEDPALGGVKRPCAACSKNTAVDRTLFTDEEGAAEGVCTDRTCFNKKTQAHVDAEAAKVKVQLGQEPQRLSLKHSGDKKVLGEYEWKPAKKDDPGAKPGIIVQDGYNQKGPKLGEVVWFTKQRSAGHSYVKSDSEKEKERREKAAKAARQTLFKEALVAFLPGSDAAQRLRTVLAGYWRQMDQDSQRTCFKAFDWPPGTASRWDGKPMPDYGADSALKAVEAWTEDELWKVLLAIPAAIDASANYVNDRPRFRDFVTEAGLDHDARLKEMTDALLKPKEPKTKPAKGATTNPKGTTTGSKRRSKAATTQSQEGK